MSNESDPSQSSSLEDRLAALLPGADEAPHLLHRAMRHAVLSGGKRLRPRLLVAVAAACAEPAPDRAAGELALQAACSVELIHAASLVHDDLPSFDDTAERRGSATVHVVFGEPLAILAGDALMSLAFEAVAAAPVRMAARALRIVGLMGAAIGSRDGMTGGQSLEAAPVAPGGRGSGGAAQGRLLPAFVERYHDMKSAALFRLAAAAGAVAMGHEPGAWAQLGSHLGHALQLADDLIDVRGTAVRAGKPVRRDAALGRPNAVLAHGEALVRSRLAERLRLARSLAASLAPESRPLRALLALIEETGCGFLTTAVPAPAVMRAAPVGCKETR